MKQIEQSIIHVPGETFGDCMRARICSILEIPPDNVPNFAEYLGPMAWWDAIRDYLRSYLSLDIIRINSLKDVTQWGTPFAVATVESPRGPWGHCVVVYKDGFIVHDPYPADIKQTGLADADEYWLIVDPYDPFPTQVSERYDHDTLAPVTGE